MDHITPMWCLPLLMQLQTYTGDRDMRTSEVSMLINGLAKGRRERQHWDLASSFQIACHMANHLVLPAKIANTVVPVNAGVTAADILPNLWT